MPDDDTKANILNGYEDNTFLFICNVRSTTPGKFPNLGTCNMSNFQPKIKIVVEVRVYAHNFKIKGGKKI